MEIKNRKVKLAVSEHKVAYKKSVTRDRQSGKFMEKLGSSKGMLTTIRNSRSWTSGILYMMSGFSLSKLFSRDRSILKQDNEYKAIRPNPFYSPAYGNRA
jgi:hypothetical protein